MQRTNKHYVVLGLQYIVHLALQLPIAVVDQHKDARAPASAYHVHRVVLHKQLLALVEEVRADVVHERTHVRRTARVALHRQRVHLGVRGRQEQLGAAAASAAHVPKFHRDRHALLAHAEMRKKNPAWKMRCAGRSLAYACDWPYLGK